jgi:hypothetical protein
MCSKKSLSYYNVYRYFMRLKYNIPALPLRPTETAPTGGI